MSKRSAPYPWEEGGANNPPPGKAPKKWPSDPYGGVYTISIVLCANRTQGCTERCWTRSNGSFAGWYCCWTCKSSGGQSHDANCTREYKRKIEDGEAVANPRKDK